MQHCDPGGNPLLDYSYEYDPAGSIERKTTEHGIYTYGYDAASRLTGADNPVLDDERYTYDNVGNRLTVSNATGTIEHNANNELRIYGDLRYDYDANGNLTEITLDTQRVFRYVYTTENRLVKVENGVGTVIAEYYYDPFGRRLWKDVGGERTYFFYSDEGLIAEYDASGNEIKTYGWQPDSTWGTNPLWLKQDGEYYFYQNDHLGTPQKLVAQNGAVVWSASYEAFGKAHVHIETVTNNLRFPGQYYDEETGLHYNWFRYYHPEIGRYITSDPISLFGGDVNLFAYVRGNPVYLRDPYGLTGVETVGERVVTAADEAWLDRQFAALGKEWLRKKGLRVLMKGIGIGIIALADVLLLPEAVGETPEELAALEEAMSQQSLSPEPYPYQPSPMTGAPPSDDDDCELDDFGRRCPKEVIQPVIVVAFSTSGHSLEHASLSVAGRTEGWHFTNPRDVVRVQRRRQYDYIAHGEVRDDSNLLFSAPSIYQSYAACPASVEVVEARIDVYRKSGGPFNLLNIGARNCAGWVCQVLQEASIQPKPPKKLLNTPSPATCDTPGLRPVHLIPGGEMKSFADIPTSLSE